MNIKRLLSAFLVSVLIICGLPVAAAEVTTAPLRFTPYGNGKFIYCNNHEGIMRSQLSDISNPNPEYIMTNRDLSEDNYTIYISHINSTGEKYTTGEQATYASPGFNIELDVQFVAKSDSKLTVSALGFEVPQITSWYENGVLRSIENSWSCLHAVSDYMQRPIYELETQDKYIPTPFSPFEISLKQGDEIWLSEYIENYTSVPWNKAVHLISDFQIESGILDVNIAALKAGNVLGDRSHHSPDAAPGKYYRDKQYKGIADSQGIVVSDALNYEIDDGFISGSQLGVTVYNQYEPDGNTTKKWYTHLNPLEDIWSRSLCAESDMMKFIYKDDTKLSYYGKSVPEDEKNNEWSFDVFRSDMTEPLVDASESGKANFKPNDILSTDIENSGNACNLGNYGVKTRYHLNIKNNGTRDRYFNYHIKTTAANIVSVLDSNGNYVDAFSTIKQVTSERLYTTLASVCLPPQETTDFYVEVILPINCVGGMENSFTITDTKAEMNYPEDTRNYVLSPDNFTGKEYYKWEKGELYLSDDEENWEQISVSEQTKAVFSGNFDNYEIKAAGENYTVRCSVYLTGPSLYGESLKVYNIVYLLDKDFNLIKQYSFDTFPTAVSYANGYYYAKSANKLYYSSDFTNWQSVGEGYSVPVHNGGRFVITNKDGVFYTISDGNKLREISYTNGAPLYVEACGNLYYYANGTNISLSKDAINWTSYDTGSKIESVTTKNGKLLINGNIFEYDALSSPIAIIVNNKIVVADAEPIIVNDRTMVPMRAILESMGARVTWNPTSRSASATLGGITVNFRLDDTAASVNGTNVTMDTPASIYNDRTMIPIRFLSESLGFDVHWNGEDRIVTISGEATVQGKYEPIKGGVIKNENGAKLIALAILKTTYDNIYIDLNSLSATFNESSDAWDISFENNNLMSLRRTDGGLISINEETARKINAISVTSTENDKTES